MQTISWRELHEIAGLIGAPVELAPRYNLAPEQDAAVIRAGAEGPRLDSLRWGLIPSWAKDPAIGNKLINARVETAAEKPSFRSSWRSHRAGFHDRNEAVDFCLVHFSQSSIIGAPNLTVIHSQNRKWNN